MKGQIIDFPELPTRSYARPETSVVLKFPGHKWKHCDRHCEGCMFCVGGLAACVTCGGAEGALTTDCCGERLPSHVLDAVQAGRLDFHHGQWICLPAHPTLSSLP